MFFNFISIEHKTSWMGRVPFGCLFGFVLILSGASILCGTIYHAMFRIDTFFNNHFFEATS